MCEFCETFTSMKGIQCGKAVKLKKDNKSYKHERLPDYHRWRQKSIACDI